MSVRQKRSVPRVDSADSDDADFTATALKKLGNRVRKLRMEKGVSLADAAAGCGVSPSLLSQVERGVVSPSLATLHSISRFMESPLFEFFLDADPAGDGLFLSPADRRILTIPGSNVEYQLITPATSRQMQVIEVVIEPRESTVDHGLSHEGYECVVAIEGACSVALGKVEHTLSVGDSLYYRAEVPHQFLNVGKRRARLLTIMSPAGF